MQQYSNCGTRLSAITPSTDFTSIRGDCPVTRAQQTSSSGVATASPSGVAGTSSSGGVVGLGPPSNGGTFSTMPNPGAAGQGSGNVPPAADGGFPPGTLGLGSGGASVRYGGWRTNAAVISTLVALVAGLI